MSCTAATEDHRILLDLLQKVGAVGAALVAGACAALGESGKCRPPSCAALRLAWQRSARMQGDEGRKGCGGTAEEASFARGQGVEEAGMEEGADRFKGLLLGCVAGSWGLAGPGDMR
eukprot:3844668-Rhodomonas_salina.1